MKKKIFILAAILLATLAASATIRYNAHCGGGRIVSTYTVGPDFFASWEEAESYYMELREILCD